MQKPVKLPPVDPYIDFEGEILRLRNEMNAIILAHYYQDTEIQDIADFVGDTLELIQKATETKAKVIICCGIKFIAESIHILNPDKRILIPDLNAGCSLDESCTTQEFSNFKEQNPEYVYVTHINCSAEIKALSDIVVTTSNAEKIITNIPRNRTILFAPDRNLGNYLINKTGRQIKLWNGTCIVHDNFSEHDLIKIKASHPQAKIIAHPSSLVHLLEYAEYIGSTTSLIKYVQLHNGKDFIVLTEPGIIHQMHIVAPNSRFYDIPSINSKNINCSECPYMRLNTIEKLYLCMLNQLPEIKLDSHIASKAKIALDKMMTAI